MWVAAAAVSDNLAANAVFLCIEGQGAHGGLLKGVQRAGVWQELVVADGEAEVT